MHKATIYLAYPDNLINGVARVPGAREPKTSLRPHQ